MKNLAYTLPLILVIYITINGCQLVGLNWLKPAPEPDIIKVALYSGGGTLQKSVTNTAKSLATDESMVAEKISAEDFVSGRLVNYNVLVMPGGTANGQRDALGKEGCQAIEKYVASGGGYIGICAGAYLPTVGWKESMRDLQLINARLHDLDHWDRGAQTIIIETIEPSGNGQRAIDIWFENGPIFVPADDPYLPDYTAMAKYRTDLHKPEAPAGQMTGKDAIIACYYGRGRVILFGPHPEKTPGLEIVLIRAVRWVGEKPGLKVKVTEWPKLFDE